MTGFKSLFSWTVTDFPDVVKINISLCIFAALGCLGLLLGWVGGCGLVLPFIWALACMGSGCLVGFLFGIPREDSGPGDVPSSQTQPAHYRQRINANLEQVSDWLTKIIVGLGLVELRMVPTHLMSMAAYMTGPEHEACQPFAGALIVYFAAGGFLFGYLYTRLYLAGAIFRAVSQMAAGIEDPLKGRWGGKNEVNERKLTAKVDPLPDLPGWFTVTLSVASTNQANPLSGNVVFHLHPAFRVPNEVVAVKDGTATVKQLAQRAFTVGAEADAGKTQLELDLNRVENVPLAFRS
jgi:hypothetical protein